MATENDKGKGKEAGIENKPAQQLFGWFGRFQDGKWFCDCNIRARCKRVTKPNSPNLGKLFWTCSKDKNDPDQCPFFIFVDEEEEAKEWLSKYGPPPPEPETPRSNEKRPEDPPKSLKTPWTLSKKRKPVSREVSDEDENSGPSNRNIVRDESPGFEIIDSPSRKVAKVAKVSTPGETSRDDMQNAAESLPTPDTGSRPRPSNRTSPPRRLENPINLSNERTSNLSSAVLRLLRSEGVELNSSIEIMIRHEIDTEMELNEVKVRRKEDIISDLKDRLDKMENMVHHLGGDIGMDDAVELSD